MGTEDANSFGGWVRQRRTALDLTRVELAQRSGCSASALRKIETDERRPSKQLAELLANCLGIAPDDRPAFIKAARGQLRVERLSHPSYAPGPGREPPVHLFNLPIPPTPLIGRESELASLGQLLSDPQCRLLTVTGPGGIGKTRLAIEIASQQRAFYPDGGCFASLASLNSSTFMVPAIADALGFAFQGQIEPRIQLFNYLRAKQALLVLDSVEHLLDGVGLFAEMLERAPGVKLLVTSRETLNLQGEWVFEIQGLPVPPSDQVARVEDYSAVALFVHSARRAQAGFELRDEEQPAVVRICQMVDGMPLGIELAAAWVSVLSCREIAQEIERSLDFLATSMRDVPERQRSLRAAFDHSWSLLGADERRVLTRLAVFRDGFEREAAEQVAGATLPALLGLVSKSLVRRKQNGRYDLHEVVRQYALSHLADDLQCEAKHERHAGYYLDYLCQREAALKSHRQKEALAELSAEVDNIRQAWAWASDHGQIARLRNASFALLYFHEVRGRYHAGERAFRRAADMLRRFCEASSADGAALQVALCDMLTNQAYFSLRRGKSAEAQATLRQCIEQLRALGDQMVLRWSLRYYGLACQLNGRFEEAEGCLRESLDLSRAAGQLWEVSINSGYLGMVAHRSGALDDARRYLSEGLALSRSLGDVYITAYHLINLAQVLVALGRHAEAREMAQESLLLTKEADDRYGIGTALYCLGLVAQAEGNALEAHAMFEHSLTLFQGLGDPLNSSRVYVQLGYLTLASGDVCAAQRLFSTAASIAKEAPLYVLDALAGLAHLRAQMGEDALALELVIHILQHPCAGKEAKGRAERLRAQLEPQLTVQQIKATEAWSQTKSFDMLVAQFLDAQDEIHLRRSRIAGT